MTWRASRARICSSWRVCRLSVGTGTSCRFMRVPIPVGCFCKFHEKFRGVVGIFFDGILILLIILFALFRFGINWKNKEWGWMSKT